MSAAKAAKAAGFKSLTELAEMIDQSTQTLNNWHNNKRKLFDAVIAGCKAIKNETGH